MAEQRVYTACVLIIGNEILSGRIQDVNLNWLALRLNEAGVRLREARVVADIEAEIVAAVNETRARYDYVFTTGGIGPTHDDITADCVAKAFGVDLPEHPEALARLLGNYSNPTELNAARRRMARIPVGGVLIDNPISRVPGFRIGNVHVLAGVPEIMRAMFDSMKHTLKGGAPVLARTVGVNLPEGRFAEGFGALQNRYPELDMGSYPYFRLGKSGAALVVRGVDQSRIDAAVVELKQLIRDLGGDPTDEQTA